MKQPKRVLCMMDLSVVGRSSLTVVGSILSACGVQVCQLPPVLLSSHTGGFGAPAVCHLEVFVEQALEHFAVQDIVFDAVYTGYLAGPAQFALASSMARRYPSAWIVADPAMADSGKLYSGLGVETVSAMQDLCAKAGLITPNYTEACLLTGCAMEDKPDAAMLAKKLAVAGRDVVITSVPVEEGDAGMLCLQGSTGEIHVVKERMVPEKYPGTGDMFTAVLVGKMMQGATLVQATKMAAAFVAAAAQQTYAGGGEPRHGVWYETCLPMLMERKD